MTEPEDTNQTPIAEAPSSPPILGTWKRIYYVVLGFLVLEIVLFTILSNAFR